MTQTTVGPTQRDILELADAMQAILWNLHEKSIKAAWGYEALCRRAYEPFRHLLDDEGRDMMPLEEALQICQEAQL